MKFSIRDLFLVTVIVAVCTAWWLDRSISRKELQGVQLRLSLAEESNELLRAVAKSRADMEANRAAFEKDSKAIHEAAERDRSYRLDAPEGNLLGPPLPKSKAPAPIPPKP